MTKQQLKALDIASVVVILIGVVVWYSTPRSVVAGPLVILLIGFAGAGVAQLVRRRQTEASTNALADRVRSERERAERERGEDRPTD